MFCVKGEVVYNIFFNFKPCLKAQKQIIYWYLTSFTTYENKDMLYSFIKRLIQKDKCTSNFIAILFIIAKT